MSAFSQNYSDNSTNTSFGSPSYPKYTKVMFCIIGGVLAVPVFGLTVKLFDEFVMKKYFPDHPTAGTLVMEFAWQIFPSRNDQRLRYW
ncbi:uncharacterized protein LY89DRAFT_727116 [Mollisia scopiformis]|uniref:Uncharacterized protein n=1 Tax=Mollisia scopiformis TaxID=149040 RepID=A0A194XVB1_MOLSC|nr:uncharacterized protein LY89DRAFT_727116 [Mollisia scopiformis]KUJ24076.1 hypothetical protein LY89DRAFT_727116 [Mollisia scopiformis]